VELPAGRPAELATTPPARGTRDGLVSEGEKDVAYITLAAARTLAIAPVVAKKGRTEIRGPVAAPKPFAGIACVLSEVASRDPAGSLPAW
jgi:hypothetical protein